MSAATTYRIALTNQQGKTLTVSLAVTGECLGGAEQALYNALGYAFDGEGAYAGSEVTRFLREGIADDLTSEVITISLNLDADFVEFLLPENTYTLLGRGAIEVVEAVPS